MKKLFLLALTLLSLSVSSDSLFEKLARAKTDYTFFHNDKKLGVIQQGITLRAVKDHRLSAMERRYTSNTSNVYKSGYTNWNVREPKLDSSKEAYNRDWDIASGGYGYGYSSYHIELVYAAKDYFINHSNVAKVAFYDKDGILLHRGDISNHTRRVSQIPKDTKSEVKFFAINLENMPLLMLDYVHTVKIIDK